MKTYAIHINAGHDRNGNPKRAYLVYDAEGKFLDDIDEGYKGFSALKNKYPEAIILYDRLPTNHATYRGDIMTWTKIIDKKGRKTWAIKGGK